MPFHVQVLRQCSFRISTTTQIIESAGARRDMRST
jgi:hypothetical protein